ncbi:hypothetical protein GGS26DRAFT_604464 [Hypomontagnella submonticulosa]|nr:hypothetical protein GGS26DRAFT_604464 [Hypomontagnella submonticulosa]
MKGKVELGKLMKMEVPDDFISERAQEMSPQRPSFTSTISSIGALTPFLHNSTNSTTENCQTLESSTSSSSNASATDMLRIHIGIGIGAAIAGIALGALISIICMRYRRRKANVDPEAKGAERRQRDQVLMTNVTSYRPATQTIPRAERAYEARENSSIYPDESASFYEPDASPQTMRAYATDFAMADRQVWREHIPSSPDLGRGIRQHPGLDIEANESAGAKDGVPTETDPVASTHR